MSELDDLKAGRLLAHLPDDRNLWDQLPTETDMAFSAFRDWLNMPVRIMPDGRRKRLQVDLAAKLDKKKPQITQWMQSYAWVARTEAYDTRIEQDSASKNEMRNAARTAINKLNQGIALLDPTNPSDFTKLQKLLKLLRDFTGQATQLEHSIAKPEELDAVGGVEPASTGNWWGRFAKYLGRPVAFVEEVLGVTVTPDQAQILEAIARGDTLIVIKGANSTGKTQDIASAIIYFKLVYESSIVITTAPSEAQVKNQLWQEIRKQVDGGNALDANIDKGGMKPSDPEWTLGPLNYARGIATNHSERFKGDHHKNFMIVIDEGPGVQKWVLDGAEQMASATGNIIIFNGNPTNPSGPFYDAFGPKSPWTKITLSALNHPNVLTGTEVIPGGVSQEKVEQDIAQHCQELGPEDDREIHDFEYPLGSGLWYRPDNIFLCRRMGEFPREGEETLIPIYAVEAAKENHLEIDPNMPADIGVDIAEKGGDYTVAYVRRGQSAIKRIRWKGYDIEESKRKIAALCNGFVRQGIAVGTIAVDAVGMGSGVASGLQHMLDEGHIHCDSVLAIQSSEKCVNLANRQMYSSQRAEHAFALAERFKSQQIDLSHMGNDLVEFETDVAAIEITRDHTGKLSYSKKDDIRKKIGHSPDDFDAMCLAFLDTTDTFAQCYSSLLSAM